MLLFPPFFDFVPPKGSVSYTYDISGNVLTVTDSHGTITRAYDALNRVSSYTDTYGKVIRYEYDAVGNLSKLIYPDNTAVTYTYDANRNLVRVTDWANRVTTYTYDVNNRVVGVTKPDGSVTATVYDSKQRVTSTVERTSGGTVITGFEYTYDDLSRIIEEKVLASSTKICYTYDTLGRVVAKTVKKMSDNSVISTEAFTYDAAGNITDAPDSCFQYDTNNRLVVFNGNTVSYDLDGNMLNDGVKSFTYDSANRLISAGGYTYTYNAEDVRIKNLCTGKDTTYTYNTNCKLSQLLCSTTNGVTVKYVYGRGLIGEESGSVFKTYHFDCRGSTVAITGASGSITDTFAYDTYGKLTGRTGTSDVIFGYNGRDGVITDGNGLVYMRARYYAPEMKRFVNADIIAGKISNAITLNRFAYANGNPVSFVDPFGLSADSRWSESDINHTWQELGFAYDGSMQDFRRLEQGLAPYAYEQWLKTGYGYSDDYYWDAMLGNYDAFYVADYGLPAVGHAYVLLKNDDGSWIRTDFNAPADAPNLIKKKENAQIYTYNVSFNYIINELSAKPEGYITHVTTQKIDYVFGFIPVIIEYEEPVPVYTSGVQYVPLKGDFNESIELAWEYNNEKYSGYDLVTNNCAHYAQEILKEGTVYNEKIEKILETSDTIIPADLYAFLYSYSK